MLWVAWALRQLGGNQSEPTKPCVLLLQVLACLSERQEQLKSSACRKEVSPAGHATASASAAAAFGANPGQVGQGCPTTMAAIEEIGGTQDCYVQEYWY
jgi:hypothetical protein